MVDKIIKLTANEYTATVNALTDITPNINYDLSLITEVSDILHSELPDNSHNIGRYFGQNVDLSEVVYVLRIRNVYPTDIFNSLDSKSIYFTKYLQDSFNNSDVLIKTPIKNLTNFTVSSETLSFFVNKNLLSNVINAENLSRSFTKILIDHAHPIEIVSKTPLKYLLDSVDATDDFLGESSVDDDQHMNFFKIITTLFYKSDYFSRIVSFVRNFQSSTSTADTLFLNVSKSISDITATTETFHLDIEKPFEDNSIINDYYKSTYGKFINELTSTSETFSKNYSKSLQTSVQTISDFTSQLVIPRSETTSSAVSDSVSLTYFKNKSELVSSSQSMEIYKQGYFLGDYCSEKYAGEIYTI